MACHFIQHFIAYVFYNLCHVVYDLRTRWIFGYKSTTLNIFYVTLVETYFCMWSSFEVSPRTQLLGRVRQAAGFKWQWVKTWFTQQKHAETKQFIYEDFVLEITSSFITRMEYVCILRPPRYTMCCNWYTGILLNSYYVCL